MKRLLVILILSFMLLGMMAGVAQAAPGGANPPKSQGAQVSPVGDFLGFECAFVTHKGETRLE
jgi:flagellar basal body-associated protein FliL